MGENQPLPPPEINSWLGPWYVLPICRPECSMYRLSEWLLDTVINVPTLPTRVSVIRRLSGHIIMTTEEENLFISVRTVMRHFQLHHHCVCSSLIHNIALHVYAALIEQEYARKKLHTWYIRHARLFTENARRYRRGLNNYITCSSSFTPAAFRSSQTHSKRASLRSK